MQNSLLWRAEWKILPVEEGVYFFKTFIKMHYLRQRIQKDQTEYRKVRRKSNVNAPECMCINDNSQKFPGNELSYL